MRQAIRPQQGRHAVPRRTSCQVPTQCVSDDGRLTGLKRLRVHVEAVCARRPHLDARSSGVEPLEQAAKLTGSVLDPKTGTRYREEILEVGGSRPAAESFKAFRGREPSIDALLRHGGMA